jgi:hypothetical protein
LLKSKREEFATAAATAAAQHKLQLAPNTSSRIQLSNEVGNPKDNQSAISGIINSQPDATSAAQASAIAAYLNNSEQPLDPIEMLTSTSSLEEYYPAFLKQQLKTP